MKSIEQEILEKNFIYHNIGDVAHLYWLPHTRSMLNKTVVLKSEREFIRNIFFNMANYCLYVNQPSSYKPLLFNTPHITEEEYNPFYYFTKEIK